MRRLVVALAVSVAAAALDAGSAAATPLQLVSVGQVKRHPTATWTLPPKVEAWAIEVATSPDQASDGSFFFENDADFDTLTPTQTSWTSEYQLDPGRYYVHVQGWDN